MTPSTDLFASTRSSKVDGDQSIRGCLDGLIFFFEAFYKSFPPQVFYLLILLVGVEAMRSY